MTKNLDKIIKYAWHDKTSFDQIKKFFSISEGELNKLMRYNLKIDGDFEVSHLSWFALTQRGQPLIDGTALRLTMVWQGRQQVPNRSSHGRHHANAAIEDPRIGP